MTTATAETALKVKRRKFTVAEYYRMAEAGILADGERVELIDGVIFTMPPMGNWHLGSIGVSNRFFVSRFFETAFVLPQCPLRLGEMSLPEPDIALLRFDENNYLDRLPGPDDVYLLVEITDTTIAHDRGRKQRLYARHGIPEYWIVNRRAAAVEVFRQPTPQGYAEVTQFTPGHTIAPLALPAVPVAVNEILR